MIKTRNASAKRSKSWFIAVWWLSDSNQVIEIYGDRNELMRRLDRFGESKNKQQKAKQESKQTKEHTKQSLF